MENREQGLNRKTILMNKCEFEADLNVRCKKNEICNSVQVFENHRVFPSYSFLNHYIAKGQWVTFLQIYDVHEIYNESMGAQLKILSGVSNHNENLGIYLPDNNPVTFLFSDLKKGNTLVILYPTKHSHNHMCNHGDDDRKLLNTQELDLCLVFKDSFEVVKREAEKLLRSKDSASQNKEQQCFGCEKFEKKLMQCASCRLAKYCSKECQTVNWKNVHKNVCRNYESLLRLACLPRYDNNNLNESYSFKPNSHHELPQYIYKSESNRQTLVLDENDENKAPIPKKNLNELKKCALCGKSNRDCLIKNKRELIKTPCCSNWICDDAHKYKMLSNKLNSCSRNHERYTVCGNHYSNGHKGNWKTCGTCKNSQSKPLYDYMVSNQFNFEKLNVKKEEITCDSCGFNSYDLNDFSGGIAKMSTSMISMSSYYCRKPMCQRIGMIDDCRPDTAFEIIASY